MTTKAAHASVTVTVAGPKWPAAQRPSHQSGEHEQGDAGPDERENGRAAQRHDGDGHEQQQRPESPAVATAATGSTAATPTAVAAVAKVAAAGAGSTAATPTAVAAVAKVAAAGAAGFW